MSETFGARLLRLRLASGLSQRQIATVRASAAYVSRLEKGERNASVKVIRELADKLGVSAAYLETGVEAGPTWEDLWEVATPHQKVRLQQIRGRIGC